MLNKKNIIISLIVLLLIVVVYRRFNVKKYEPQSIYLLIQDGIKLSKNRKSEEARIKFQSAYNLTLKQGFYMYPGDIIRFSSLINEFKVKKDGKYFKLFNLFSKDLREKVINMTHSNQLNDEFKKSFYEELNRILDSNELEVKLSLKIENFSSYILQIINNAKKNDCLLISEFNKDKILKVFINRMYLYSMFPLFFSKPLSIDELKFNEALSYNEEGKIDESNKILEQIINKSNCYYKPFILLARNYERKNDLKNAIKILEQGINKNPQNEKLLTELAALFFKTNKPNKARDLIEKSLDINPEYKYAVEGLKVIERKKNKKLKDSSFYRKLYTEKSDDLYILSNLSLSLLNENKTDEADKILIKALGLFPKDVFLLKLKARIEGMKNNFGKTISYILDAKKNAKEKDPEIYLILGITYFNQFLIDEAYSTIKEGIKYFPNDPYLVLNLAKISEGSVMYKDEAIPNYKKYLKLNLGAKNKVKIEKRIDMLEKKLEK